AGDPMTFLVTNTNNSGTGSLRQAILNANANPGLDTITFAIPGVGTQVISPFAQLPAIPDPVVLHAPSQPGSGRPPPSELRRDGTIPVGLTLSAGNTIVQGLAIDGFAQDAIRADTLGGDVIRADYLGTDATGAGGLRNGGDGVRIAGISDNTIGGTTFV